MQGFATFQLFYMFFFVNVTLVNTHCFPVHNREFNFMTILFPQITSGEMYMVFSKRLYSRSECNNYVAALYKVIGTFLFGASVSQSLTDLAKYMIGRPRPNFIAVCDPDWKMINCSAYVTELECRGSHANVTESR